MKNKYSTSLAVAALLNSRVVLADQPVHCLRGQVYGVWNFHVNEKSEKVNLFQVDEVCTHKLPNKLQIINKDHAWSFAQTDVWRVKLMDKFQAEATFCKGGKDCESKHIAGTWSDIYDQSFKVELDNGLRFLSNFKYSVKPQISEDPTKDGADEFTALKTGDYVKFDTQCDKTMVGFVQNMPSKTNTHGSMAQHPITCFWGQQDTHYDMEKTVQVKTDSDAVKIAVITTQNRIVTADDPKKPSDETNLQLDSDVNILAQSEVEVSSQSKVATRNKNRGSSKRINAHLEHKATAHTDAAISFINKSNFGWKADPCKLSQSHADYPAYCDAVNLAQTSPSDKKSKGLAQEKAKAKTKAKAFGEKTDGFKKALEKANQFSKKYKNANDIPEDEIPESYTFGNIDGYDFLGKIRDQGSCGSCYTVSFTQVVESRLKMKYGKEVPQHSPQQLMQCNYMNEGCDGGWSFFHGFLAENGYMTSEQCAPYLAKTKGVQCSKYADCKPVSRVQSSYFVGGAYGESSEKKMMKEILRNGIVNGELNVPRVFSYYQEGILSNDHEAKMSSYLEYSGVAKHHKEAQQAIGSEENKKAKKQITDRDLEDYGIAWMNLNHSVVITGWGVDPKTQTKYWIVRNSYGEKWGMAGDFWVRRGENDFGIESETTGYDVRLCDDKSSTTCNEVPLPQ